MEEADKRFDPGDRRTVTVAGTAENATPSEEPPGGEDNSAVRGGFVGLSSKLLILTIVFVMLSEVAIYVPSIANFQNTWMQDKLTESGVAATVLNETHVISDHLQTQLLTSTGAIAIALTVNKRRQLIAMSEMPPPVDLVIDMSDRSPMTSILQSFDTLVFGGNRIIRLVGPAGMLTTGRVEVVLPDAELRTAMLGFSVRILALSLIISIITATLVYFSLRWLFVRPLQRLTASMAHFAEDPEDAGRIIKPSNRKDELGMAEIRLADMQRRLSSTLHQQRRLADLGLAVSKINHDLRNLLASAQLFLERLEGLPDPTVQRLAPKIIAALDRAVGYTSAVLAYGKAQEAPPNRRLIDLQTLVREVGEVLSLDTHADIEWNNAVAAQTEVDADPEHLFRVLVNLCRNSVQAMESDREPSVVKRLTVEAARTGGVAVIRINDTGPGVPAAAKDKLFRAFQGSVKAGGTGLGLAIASELIHAHGGRISLVNTDCGAAFEISLPDRPVDISAARKEAISPGLAKEMSRKNI
ncbi:MAG: HAMP domain-containing sensor histidine kinase [Stappiaceae bacterium]